MEKKMGKKKMKRKEDKGISNQYTELYIITKCKVCVIS